MKNINYAVHTTKTRTKLALFFMFVVASFQTMQAYENVFSTAETLTQSYYSSHDIEKTTSLFAYKNIGQSTVYIPSTQEIIAQISQLQNSHGYITDKQTRQQAVDALDAAIKATFKALLQISSPSNDPELGIILRHQQQILRIKMSEINRESMLQSCTTSPTIHAAVAATMAIVVIAGITYYCNALHEEICHVPTLPTSPTDNETQIVYKKINVLLDKFLDPQDKAPLSLYITESKKLREELQLHAQDNAVLIDVLDTVIESENRMDYGFGSMQQIKNDLFWVNILCKKSYYTSVFNQISQRNISDMDFKQLWLDKGWI